MSAYVLSNGQRVYPAFVLNDESGGGIVTPPASFRLSTGEQVLGIVLVDENGEIAANPTNAVLAPDYDETVIPWYIGGTTAPGANNLVLSRAQTRADDLTVAGIQFKVSAATGGNVKVCVYTYDGTTFTLLGSSASTAVGPINTRQTVNLTAPVVVPGGVARYYGIVTDGTASFIRTAAGLDTDISFITPDTLIKSSSFTLPATFTKGDAAGTGFLFWLRTAAA